MNALLSIIAGLGVLSGAVIALFIYRHDIALARALRNAHDPSEALDVWKSANE